MGIYVVLRTVDPADPDPNDFNFDSTEVYHFNSKALTGAFRTPGYFIDVLNEAE